LAGFENRPIHCRCPLEESVVLARILIASVFLMAAAACTTTVDDSSTTSAPAGSTSAPSTATTVAGPGESTTTTAPGEVDAPPVVLRAVVDEPRLPGFRSAAEQFSAGTGVEIEITVAEYADIVGLVDEVDIVIGTHVDLWRLADEGRLVELELGGVTDRFEPVALSAVTHDGAFIGLPFGGDAVALVWNPALISGPPDDLADLAEACAELGESVDCLAIGGGVDTSLLHHSAFIDAGAGAVFLRDEVGVWNPQSLGLEAAGEIGLAVLEDLVGAGLVPAMSVEGARDSFLAGQSALYVTGPWDLGILADADAAFVVAPFSTIAGEAAGPLVGVQAAAVSAASEYPVIATGFLRDYVATSEIQRRLDAADPRVPVFVGITDDETRLEFLASFRSGEPIPPIAEMDDAWQIVGEAISDIRQGAASSSEAMAAAEEAMAGVGEGP